MLRSSDTSRFTYIINELKECGKIRWTIDKKGVKIKKYVINPLLEYMQEKIGEYMNENSMVTSKAALLRLQASVEIYDILDKGTLASDIVKYLAPYFCVMKEEETKKNLIK